MIVDDKMKLISPYKTTLSLKTQPIIKVFTQNTHMPNG